MERGDVLQIFAAQKCPEKENELPWRRLSLCYPWWGLLMRWLMISFIVSLGALLIAAAGMARHIWLQRAKLRSSPSPAFEPADDSELELEH
jgi:hypothetical protein